MSITFVRRHKLKVAGICSLLVAGFLIAILDTSTNPVIISRPNSQKSSTELLSTNFNREDKALYLKSESSETPFFIAPAPEDRHAQSKLSNRMKRDMQIEEDLPYEEVFYATAIPDDPIYPQWYTTIIDAPAAWDISTGSSATLVAVIDTGFALDHEDLNSAWFINSGEQGTTASGEACWTGTPLDKETNNCDDDGNGFIDDWRGWDFAGNDNNPQTATNAGSPGSSHGTKSAGLVGGRGNNTLGTASINWQTKILPIQGLYDAGYGYSSDLAAGIYYAVEMGADVINMSLGGPAPDSYTRAAVQYAQENNVIIVASSGNCGDEQTSPQCTGYPSPGGMGYPARYPETIAVGATTSTDEQAVFSSWGDELTIVAPGSGTIQTPSWSSINETNLYSSTSYGTSFSAPIVSGAIAIIKSEYPKITATEVEKIIAQSSDKVLGMSGNDWTRRYGWGRLNMYRLLQELARYNEQLLKYDGYIAEQSESTLPQISSSAGHINATAIRPSDTVRTYCVTTPLTNCEIVFNKVGSSYSVSFDDRLSNNQGIAIFTWTGADLGAGTWNVRVGANGLTSKKEQLIIR